MEKGVGFLHVLTHKVEFEQLGIPPHQLLELAEASTTVGMYAGIQGAKDGTWASPLPSLSYTIGNTTSLDTKVFTIVGMTRIRLLSIFTTRSLDLPSAGRLFWMSLKAVLVMIISQF